MPRPKLNPRRKEVKPDNQYEVSREDGHKFGVSSTSQNRAKELRQLVQRDMQRLNEVPDDPEQEPNEKFRRPMLEMIYKYSLLGASNHEIAALVGVDKQTFDTWINEKPGVADALACGREIADAEVVQALHKRAIGYSHPAVKIFFDKDSGEVIKVPYTEFYPPSEKAAELWLRNKQSARWNQPSQLEVQGPSGPPQFIIQPVLIQDKRPNLTVIDGDKVDEPDPTTK